jgi:hypothetical protein
MLLIIVIFASLFYVFTQKQRLDGRALTLDKKEYGIGEKAILTIRNKWESTITVGVAYGLSRMEDGAWVEVSVLGPNEAWTAAARILHPGESYKQVIKLDELQEGKYRLEKEIHHIDLDDFKTYYIEFTITG